jgi:hypothetical protein
VDGGFICHASDEAIECVDLAQQVALANASY